MKLSKDCITFVIFIFHSLLISPPLTTSPLESIMTSTPPAFIITESELAVMVISLNSESRGTFVFLNPCLLLRNHNLD